MPPNFSIGTRSRYFTWHEKQYGPIDSSKSLYPQPANTLPASEHTRIKRMGACRARRRPRMEGQTAICRRNSANRWKRLGPTQVCRINPQPMLLRISTFDISTRHRRQLPRSPRVSRSAIGRRPRSTWHSTHGAPPGSRDSVDRPDACRMPRESRLASRTAVNELEARRPYGPTNVAILRRNGCRPLRAGSFASAPTDLAIDRLAEGFAGQVTTRK